MKLEMPGIRKVIVANLQEMRRALMRRQAATPEAFKWLNGNSFRFEKGNSRKLLVGWVWSSVCTLSSGILPGR